MPKKQLIAAHANRVTIYVWLRRISAAETGHTALRTYAGGPNGEGVYASFWPNAFHKRQLSLSGVGGIHSTYQMDINDNEKREPDVIVHLYSLEVDRINEEYIRFVHQGCNWSIWGSTLFRSENTRNCSGLVNHLLGVGGITQLVATYAQRWGSLGYTVNETANEVVGMLLMLGAAPASLGVFTYYGAKWGYKLGGPVGGLTLGAVGLGVGGYVSIISMLMGLVYSLVDYDTGGNLADSVGAVVGRGVDEALITPDNVAVVMQCGLVAEREQYEIIFPSTASELPHVVPQAAGKKCIIL